MMEKVQSGSLTEEFSFSRALHLMRYAGAKVRHADWDIGYHLRVRDGFIVDQDGEEEGWIECEEIMGNWTLYDEELHG